MIDAEAEQTQSKAMANVMRRRGRLGAGAVALLAAVVASNCTLSDPQQGKGGAPAQSQDGGSGATGGGGADANTTAGSGDSVAGEVHGGAAGIVPSGEGAMGGLGAEPVTQAGGSIGGASEPDLCPGADLKTDRLNCGSCENVCHAPYDCAKGECGVCANGCAVLGAPVTAQQRQSLFQIAPTDYFTPQGPLTMTAYVATGTKVTVTFSAVYEEGGRGDVSRSFTTGDWVTLTLTPEPAKGSIAWLEVTLNEVSTVKPSTTLYVEEVTGVPGETFEFERSAGDVTAVLPVDEDPAKPYYVLGSVDWLGAP